MVSETSVESTINSPTQNPSGFCVDNKKSCDRFTAASTRADKSPGTDAAAKGDGLTRESLSVNTRILCFFKGIL
jgi:hypothetical protein